MLTSTVVAGNLIETAARALADAERTRLPDLTAVTVLLPNLACSRRFSDALFQAAGSAVLLLPRLTTLAALAGSVPIAVPIASTQQRISDIYHALLGRDWLAREDLWSLAYEVAAVVDEMNAAGHGLPATPTALLAQIHAVYRSGHDKPLEFEAKLLFELWYALSHKRGAVDPMAARHLALARIAANASGPLYVVGLGRLTRREQSFLTAYSERAPVYVFESDDHDYQRSALPRAIYVAAWAPYAQSPPSIDEALKRVEHLRAAGATPIDNVSLLPAHSLEQEAANLARVVRHWLASDHRSIGIIALDRLVARRLRALLERDRIAIDDEAGWALSTMRAAGILMALASADRPQASAQIAFLRSALTFTGWLSDHERLALARVEQELVWTKRNDDAALQDFAARLAPNCVQPLQKLNAALRRVGQKPRPLALWTAALSDAIDIVGLKAGLAADSAGLACLNLLETLQRGSADDANAFEKGEWLRWLDREFEAATFRTPMQGAAVTFTHLKASRLRRFDCVAFAGADDTHLPGRLGARAFFNESVRCQLGLAHHAAQLREIESDLIGLCSSSREIVVSWQQTSNGETNLPSRYFSRLQNLHQRLFATPLRTVELPLRQDGESDPHPLSQAPAPSALVDMLPQRISASAYNSLLACPYQFYAQFILRLRERESNEDIEKRDYGILIHRILQTFHTVHASVLAIGEQAACAALAEISDDVFHEELERDFSAHAWLSRWHAQIPAYIAWQRNREQQGWHWFAGEQAAQIELALGDGRSVVLNGRIDRIDVRDDNGVPVYSIFDYKSQKAKPLGEKLAAAGEDVQLPFYATLRPDVAEVAYLALDGELEAVAPTQDIGELRTLITQRLQEMLEALAAGAPMPAHGDNKSCGYCKVRVVCRRDYW